MRYFTVLSIFFLYSISLTLAQKHTDLKEGDYVIYSVKEKKLVEPSVIIDEMDNYDVLFYGEEHNDVITHSVQDLLFNMLFKKYGEKATVSMEMFDRDVQYILDEYLNGDIKEGYFQKDSRCWTNYKDYRPMVEFAKENKLNVVAANAPFRYVSLVNKKGIDTLMMLSDQAKMAMAPLPYGLASGDYAEKLRNLGKDESKKKKVSKKEKAMQAAMKMDSTKTMKYNIIPGHSLWDATMAYSISEYKKANPDAKLIHLNGRFHTEERFGIVQRLAEYDPNIKSLIITSEAVGKNIGKIDFSEYSHLGDYIILTKTKVGK